MLKGINSDIGYCCYFSLSMDFRYIFRAKMGIALVLVGLTWTLLLWEQSEHAGFLVFIVGAFDAVAADRGVRFAFAGASSGHTRCWWGIVLQRNGTGSCFETCCTPTWIWEKVKFNFNQRWKCCGEKPDRLLWIIVSSFLIHQ